MTTQHAQYKQHTHPTTLLSPDTHLKEEQLSSSHSAICFDTHDHTHARTDSRAHTHTRTLTDSCAHAHITPHMQSDAREHIYTKDVICVMAASFFFMFSTMMVTPLINGYASFLGADSVIAGFIAGSMSVISLFLRPVAGNLSDHFSKYRLSCIAGVLIAIGVFGCALSLSTEMLLISRIINGCGFVLATVCMTTWLGLLVPRAHVGEAMGVYGLMNALAMALAPACAINLFGLIGYRTCMIISGISSICMLISIQFVSNHAKPLSPHRSNAATCDETCAQTSPQSSPQSSLQSNIACTQTSPQASLHSSVSHTSLWERVRTIRVIQKDALPVALIMICFGIPYFATQIDLVEYAKEYGTSAQVGYFFMIYAAALLLIRLRLKAYFDTRAYGTWFWWCCGAIAVYLMLMSVLVSNIVMIIAAILLSLGYGIIYSVNQSSAMMLAPTSEQGLASSTFYLGIDISMALAPMLGGVLFTHVSIEWFFPCLLFVLPCAICVYLWKKSELNACVNERKA